MAAESARAEWEDALLEAGLDPADVDERRELSERLHAAVEAIHDAVERSRTFSQLLLEGHGFKEAERISGEAYRGPQSIEELRAVGADIMTLICNTVEDQDPALHAEIESLRIETDAKREKRREQRRRRQKRGRRR